MFAMARVLNTVVSVVCRNARKIVGILLSGGLLQLVIQFARDQVMSWAFTNLGSPITHWIFANPASVFTAAVAIALLFIAVVAIRQSLATHGVGLLDINSQEISRKSLSNGRAVAIVAVVIVSTAKLLSMAE